MKVSLAEKLLVKIMDWSLEDVSIERPLIQAMANLKYDDYQQFSPGIRFIESLAQWLVQFESIEERRILYDFVKKHLIFISNTQVAHLVNLSFSTEINPILIKKVASTLNLNEYQVKKIIKSEEYSKVMRQSLFIGLSDGSRIDQLRRFAHLDNEQVLTTYYIDNEKVEDMLTELESLCPTKKFTSIFLIDDFTASGTSYARFEIDKAKGKILKMLNKIYFAEDKLDSNKKHFSDLIEKDNLSIHIIFYIATEEAIDKITNEINKYITTYLPEVKIEWTIKAIQIIGKDAKNEILSNSNFVDIISNEKYFDMGIVDKHYKKGKHDKPYLGFNECTLPLVLNHNSPNNSIPILWFSDSDKIKGLFPRIKRHKE